MIFQSLLPRFEKAELHSLDELAFILFENIRSEMTPLKDMLNPEICDKKFLPFLAYENAVDFWSDDLNEQEKRNLITFSKKLKRKKGTIWAINEVLDLVGFTDRANGLYADIKEGLKLTTRDGTYRYDGIFTHFYDDDWAKYVIYIPKPISIQKAQIARRLIEEYAPKRSTLVTVVYQKLVNRDKSYFYNNEITHGRIGVENA
jgi:phage tail P2-like protein